MGASPNVEHSGISNAYFTGSGAWALTGLRNIDIDPGIAAAVFGADGAAEPLLAAVMGAMPAGSFTTTDLATVLAKLGVREYAIPQTTVITALDIYEQKQADLGQRASGSSHRKYHIVRGLLVPMSLSARQSGEAELALALHALWDGTTAGGPPVVPVPPIVISESQALAGAPGLAAVYTLGPIKINGSFVPGVQDVSLNFGLGAQVHGPTDGEDYPRAADVASWAPSGGFTTLEAGTLYDLGVLGASISADVIIFLRKKQASGPNVPDATAEHIAVTFQAGLIVPGRKTLSHPSGSRMGVQFMPVKKTGQNVITLSTAAAIA